MNTIPNVPKFVDFADDITKLRYSHTVQGNKESWEEIAWRVVQEVVVKNKFVKLPLDIAHGIFECIRDRLFIPGGRILSQAGRGYHQTDNCFLLRAEDTREGWAELAYKSTMMFMSGGGVGVDYSDIRPYGTELKRSGGIGSGPCSLIEMVNGIGKAARQGGERRGAIYASLKWNHDDIHDFIKMKVNGGLEHTNISVRFDKEWLDDYTLTSNVTLTNTTISIATLPPNKKLTSVVVMIDTSASQTNGTVALGWSTDADAAAWGAIMAPTTITHNLTVSTIAFPQGGDIGTAATALQPLNKIAGFQKVTSGTQVTVAVKLNNWTMTTGTVKTIVRYT